MEKPGTHKDLIRALGGPIKVARSLGMDEAIPTTVHWGARGIPSRYWHRIAEMAQNKGISITSHDLEHLPATAEAA